MGHPTRSGKLTAVRRAVQARPKADHALPKRPTHTDEWLTVEEVCDELKVSRRTFDRWRAQCSGPRSVRLGGSGPVRVRRSWLEEWIETVGRGSV
jgi:excisionase family DNA binding protein